jgi:hypothetical protein
VPFVDVGGFYDMNMSLSGKVLAVAGSCICFTDPCGSRRKPSADKRTLRPGTSKFAPVAR